MKLWHVASCLLAIFPSSLAQGQVVATPRWMERCEKQIVELAARAGRPYPEIAARMVAITLYACDERKLLDRATKQMIADGQIGPYFDAYAKNPNVWRLPD